MNMFFLTLFIIAYVWWFVIEQLALLCRAAGVHENAYSYGKVLHDQFLTLTRYGGFFLGPFLGGAVFYGANLDEIIFASMAASLMAFLLGFITHKNFLKMLSRFSLALSVMKSRGVSFPRFLAALFSKTLNRKVYSAVSLSGVKKIKLIYMAALINMFAAIAVVLINILAFQYEDLAVVILQSSALVSGIGTFMYQFFLNPEIAKIEHQNSSYEAYTDVIEGRVLSQLLLFVCFAILVYI